LQLKIAERLQLELELEIELEKYAAAVTDLEGDEEDASQRYISIFLLNYVNQKPFLTQNA